MILIALKESVEQERKKKLEGNDNASQHRTTGQLIAPSSHQYIKTMDEVLLLLFWMDVYRAKAKETQGMRTDLLQNSAKSEPKDTRKEISDTAKVSHDTIMRVKKIKSSRQMRILDQYILHNRRAFYRHHK